MFKQICLSIAAFGLLTACNQPTDKTATTTTQGGTVVAYVEAETIVNEMPEYKEAKDKLAALNDSLQKQLQDEGAKFQAYQQKIMSEQSAGTLSPQKEREAGAKLQKMQEDLQQKMAAAEQQIMGKEAELTKPMYDKFNEALKTVAKANGYAYIIDKKVLLYSEDGIDATAKVKTQLGLK